jgi:predicted acylesterase/phospholipase RssA
MNSMIDTLVFSAAGYNIIYEIGICAELQRHHKFYISTAKDISKDVSVNKNKDRIRTVIGTSAGSIICLAVAVGWDLDELIPLLVDKINGKRIYYGSLFRSLLCLPYYSYLFDQDIRYTILDIILSKIGQDATFSDIGSNVDLIIVSTELVTGATILFNKSNTPNVKLKTAALASSSIPVLFKPIYIDKSDVKHFIQGCLSNKEIPDRLHLVDGGFSAYYPIDFAPKIETTIGVCIIDEYVENNNDNLFGMISHIKNLWLNISQQSTALSDMESDRTLIFQVLGSTIKDYFGILTRVHVEEMIQRGKQAAIDFINRHS